MRPIDPRCHFCRDQMLMLVTPGEHHERAEGADECNANQPPDVPDQGEAHDGCKKSADEAGSTVARHADVLILGLSSGGLLLRPLLDVPVSLLAFDIRQHRKIEFRWR